MWRQKLTLYVIGTIIGVGFLLMALSLIPIGGVPFFIYVDAPLHDQMVRWRNVWSPPPVSPDIALVAVDDYTMRKIGRYGEGEWRQRKPFTEQLHYFRTVFKPTVVAYDFLFRDDQGDAVAAPEADGLAPDTDAPASTEAAESPADPSLGVLYDPTKMARIVNALQQGAEGGDGPGSLHVDPEVLTLISQLTSQLGSERMTEEMSLFSNDSSENRTQLLLAYNFNATESGRRGWSEAEILGTDKSNLSEDMGTAVPYLRDVRIPMEYVSGLHANYPWATHSAALPEQEWMDYSRMAYIDIPRDKDGVTRHYPLVRGMRYTIPDAKIADKEKWAKREFFLPSLAFLAVLYHWHIDLQQMNQSGKYEIDGKPIIEIHLGDYIQVRKPDGEVRRIPIDQNGVLYIDFVAKTDRFDTVPFYFTTSHFMGQMREEVTETGKNLIVDADLQRKLERRLLFVGTTFTGGTDTGPIPGEEYAPMVVVHMNVASNILTGTYLVPLRNGSLLIIAILTLLIVPAVMVMAPLRFSVYQFFIFCGYSALVYYSIHINWLVLPISAPLIFILVSYLTVVLYNYLMQEREKRKIRGMFATMVSADVLEFMEENPESFSLSGRQMEATMFFSDVAGFTTISETLTPTQLVDLLNQYLTPMTESIMSTRGYVDKYSGDGIMAEWGALLANPNHARDACWCALDQQKRLRELRPEMMAKFGVDIVARMGLNSGIVSAGNMGSERRFSYTVMGDAVNQAARFEPANKDYGTYIMIGETTFKLAQDDIEVRHLDKIIVKGKTVPINIYELVARKGELEMDMRAVIDIYHEGLRLHWERNWDDALARFGEALQIRPDDGPSQAMLARVERYKVKPPPDGWMGEYIRTSKD